jgi:hypothetical protein
MRAATLLAIGLVAASFLVVLSPSAGAWDCGAEVHDPVTGQTNSICDPLGICQTTTGQKLAYCHAM